ncbi:hypothetical protein SAY87_018384 [Trapa incisa]|uniref:EF-hand domain-containing protein n=1 Tax=Trapa incisa TaxID=236973 RepID=A0AAN7L2D6_9MYRT|nr:hypothetical protein SAY87_018384 [Trapa incisa]
MPAILKRIFLIYNLLLSLVPKKLRSFFFIPPIIASSSTAAMAPSPAGYGLTVSPPGARSRVTDPRELRRVFQMFDRNGDGLITKDELRDSLGNLGIFIPDKELDDTIRHVDANGDGCVDAGEFESLYASIMEGEVEEEADMKEAFDVFDQNGDGFITVEELRSVMASLGMKQGRTLEDCKRMIVNVDADGDGPLRISPSATFLFVEQADSLISGSSSFCALHRSSSYRSKKNRRALMQQRRSLVGRPSGTDGSDFSYRMVVDSRYQKVARGRSRLRTLILIQAVIMLVAALPLFLSVLKGEAFDVLSALSFALSIFSILIGELGAI